MSVKNKANESYADFVKRYGLKEEKSSLKWVCITSIILLIIAALPPEIHVPVDYFEPLRLIIFLTSAYMGMYWFNIRMGFWTVVFILISFLFNPFLPFSLDRSTWELIDLFSILSYLITFITVQKNFIDTV